MRFHPIAPRSYSVPVAYKKKYTCHISYAAPSLKCCLCKISLGFHVCSPSKYGVGASSVSIAPESRVLPALIVPFTFVSTGRQPAPLRLYR